MNRSFLTWGLFLILVGGIPLAVRAGALSETQVAAWWNLWPLVIVGIGVGLVLSRTSLEVLGGLIVAATFGIMVGGFIATGAQGFPGSVCGDDPGTAVLPEQSGAFGGPAAVAIEFNCGELEVTWGSGSGWTFTGTGEADHVPRITADATSLEIRAAERRVWLPFAGSADRWQVVLPGGQPVALRVQLNAGEARVVPGAGALRDVDLQVNFGSLVADLGGATAIGPIEIQTNAGSAAVTLPDLSMSGRVQVNAGTIELCTPPDAGLRIESGGGLGANNFEDRGLVQNGDAWETPGYATATTQIDLEAEANVGTISLNPEDGCNG